MKLPKQVLISPNLVVEGVQYDMVAQAFDQRMEGRENWLNRVGTMLEREAQQAAMAAEHETYSR